MKNRRARTIQPSRPIDDEIPTSTSPFIVPDEIDESEQTYADWVQQFGPGECQIKVYKIVDGLEHWIHTFNSPQSANEEGIAKLGRGGGVYLTKAIIGGVFRGMRQFAIMDPVPNGHTGAPAAGESQLMVMFREQMSMMQKLMETLAHRGAGAPAEPVSQLVAALAQMQALAQPKEMPVDTMTKLIELGKSLNGGGDDDSIMSIVKEVAKSAAPALGGLLLSGRGLPATGVPLPPPPVQLQPAEQPVMGVEEMDKQLLKMAIDFLKKKCLAGSDPRLYIAWVVENYEEPQFKPLISKCLNEDFSTFVSFDAEIGKEPFNKFFRAIYDGLRSGFESEDTVAGDTGGPTRNLPNVTGDANTRKSGRK